MIILPELNWEGKDEALKVAKETKTRLLEFDKNFSFGEKNSGNMIVQGNNLEVLKSLLPFYRGQIKCIYIDPPYNTGAAFEHYNDNFPHSDWLSMMYPRLELLRDFLSDDGAIFISIDDTEQAYLKIICDEIFGRNNFVCNTIWRTSDNSNNDSKKISIDHNSTLIYSKNNFWQPNKLLDETKQSHFKNPTNDPRGAYFDGNPLNSPNPRPNLCYEIESPTGFKIQPPANGWRWSKKTLQEKISSGEIFFTENGRGIKRRTYLADMQGLPPSSLWIDLEKTGSTRKAKNELKKIFPENKTSELFKTPKPTALIEYILQIATDKNSIILDAFAGSGTTAHAVLNLNAADGGNRKFILIEVKDYCKTITAERVRRVGGSFDFYRLGAKISDEDGKINPAVTFAQLANFVWFSATKTPYLEQANSPLLGIFNGAAIYLLYNDILQDKSVKCGNILTKKILSTLPQYDGDKIIYGSACRLDENFLRENQIIFRQIPKELNL